MQILKYFEFTFVLKTKKKTDFVTSSIYFIKNKQAYDSL